MFEFLGAPLSGSSSFLGSDKVARQTSFTYTATRSIFSFEAAGLAFNATFLSPVTPNDVVRQSLPFSYLVVDVDKHALANRSVSVYTDISGEWATGDSSVDLVRPSRSLLPPRCTATDEHPPSSYRPGPTRARRASASMPSRGRSSSCSASSQSRPSGAGPSTLQLSCVPLSHSAGLDDGPRADVHLLLQRKGVVAGSGSADKLRARFARHGKLDGTHDVRYRQVDDDQPVFGFSVALSEQEPAAVFTIGHVRDPYVVRPVSLLRSSRSSLS